MNVLSVIVPIFGLILVGWLLKSIGLFPDGMVRIVNGYVYYVGITVITFLSLHDTSLSLLLDWRVYLLNLVPMALVAAAAYGTAKLLRLEKATLPVFVVCAFFGNTGYIGFPLNISVQGRDALALTAFISTLYTVIVFTLGALVMQAYSTKARKGIRLHKIPIFWAALIGLALSWIVIPPIVRLPLELISDSTSPLALLMTGALISASGAREHLKAVGAVSALKLLLAPAAVAVTGALAGIGGRLYTTSLLEAATPVAVMNTVLAGQFDLDQKFASSAVIISTILFLLTLILILFLV